MEKLEKLSVFLKGKMDLLFNWVGFSPDWEESGINLKKLMGLN